MRKRILITLLILALLGLILTVVWKIADWPPPRMILRYGLTPGCEPTGEEMTIEGVEFVEIGAGSSRMGSTYLAKGGNWFGELCAALGLPWGDQPEPSDEMPVHWVEFRRGFWIAKYEVTNEQYERFDVARERSVNSSKGDRGPVVEVSWREAKRYCFWLAEKSGLPVRLPSEAEWECACRAGSATRFTFGDDSIRLSEYAWFRGDLVSKVSAHEVGTRKPNAWGIFDMHGNVWEWCADAGHTSYEGAPTDGSPWAWVGEHWICAHRVARGGSWYTPSVFCESGNRDAFMPDFSSWDHGFRPAFTLADD